MKHILILILLIPVYGLGQGYVIPSELIPAEFRTNFNESKELLEAEKRQLQATLRTDSSEFKSENLYKLAYLTYNMEKEGTLKSISLLDSAISLNPNNANYYALRGIIKYNWGAWSKNYDIGEGCPDLNMSISLGLSEIIRNSEAIVGILGHPSCK